MSNKLSRRKADKASRLFSDKVAEKVNDLSIESIYSQIAFCRPSGSTSAYGFKWDYLETEILSKYCDPTGDPSIRMDRAVAKMLASDEACRTLNQEGIADFKHRHSVMFRARQIVSAVMGNIHEWRDSLTETHHFTSGASVCRTRRFGDPYYKYDPTRSLTVTPRALPYAKYLIASTPLWGEQAVKICRGNAVFTVPKESDIDRAACKEPALNQALQTSVGDYIRNRLKLFGIDLNDQSRNQELARRGSINNRIATLDLKSASDSISNRIVFELFADCWVHLFDDLRSPEGQLPNGDWITWEKHSTMGNGYTFELESLIFWALSRASIDISRTIVHGKRDYYNQLAYVSVYGDDIIIPSHYYTDVVTTLKACGFTVNDKKSFHDGPFRESCGGHFYNGHNVKPFYIKRPIDSPDRVIWLLNSLRKWAADDDGWCDPSVYQLWLRIRRQFVPPHFLGGKNCASISEVVSPHKPRFSVRWVKPTNEIDGPRAILRWFQYNNSENALNSIRIKYKHSDDRYIDYNESDEDQIVDFHRIADMGAKEQLRVKRYVPSLVDNPLFPQEAVACGFNTRSIPLSASFERSPN